MTWEPDYITLAEAKAYLRIADTDDDALLPTWITAASRAVDTFCHRQFGKVEFSEPRTYTPVWDPVLRQFSMAIDDLSTSGGFQVIDANGVTVTAADYRLSPVNAVQRLRPFERITLSAPGPLVLTGVWGWTSVPLAVKNATFLQTARFAARRDSPYGIAGSPTEGGEQRLLASLDPDVKVSLGSKYRREWWAA